MASVRGCCAVDAASAVCNAERRGVELDGKLLAWLGFKPSPESRQTFNDEDCAVPSVLCSLQTSDVHSELMTHVLDAAVSISMWYTSLLVPNIIGEK
jgi:hypothetical protein